MTKFDFSDYFLRHTRARTFHGETCCRMTSFLAQHGHGYISGRPLESGRRHMLHRNRRHYGGLDTASNTFYEHKGYHRLRFGSV